MKKPLFIVAVATSVFLFASCNSSSTETEENSDGTEVVEEEEGISIVGEWKMSAVDLGMEIPAGQEATFEQMKKDMIAGSSQSFTADGVATTVSSMKKEIVTASGTYTVKDDVLTLVYNGVISTLKIKTLEEHKLILEVDDRGSIMTMTYKR